MKVALITMTRTRSSFLLDVLCKAYNLPNLYEPYDSIPHLYVEKFLKKNPDKIWEKYIIEQTKLTQTMFENHESFGLKIFPANFANFFKLLPNCNKGVINFTSNDLLDIKTVLRLTEYDKVILLNRSDITDLVVSQYYANQKNKFLVKKSEKGLIKHLEPNGKLFLSTSATVDEFGFRARIVSHIILNYMPKYLNKMGIDYIKLDYEEVPKFVKEHYPNIESDFIDTDFDYKNKILNYNEIKEKSYDVYRECLENFNLDQLFL